MNKFFLMVGAAALAATMPASAKGPKHDGSGKGHHSMNVKQGAKSNSSAHSSKGYAVSGSRTKTRLADTNRDGRIDSRDVLDRNLDGVDDRTGRRYGGSACPSGLAKKSPACVPPGQAKRQFAEGQRLPSSYNAFTDYNAIPEAFRAQVPYSTSDRYIYRDNQVYVVDPGTRLVTSIINLIR